MTRLLRAALLLTCAASPTLASAYQPDVRTLAAVPRLELPAAVVQKALAEPIKEQPYQFAVPVDLSLSPSQGSPDLQGDTLHWRLRLHSEGAVSLSLQLAHPVLPEGAALWTYDPQARVVHGPYRAANVTASGLWTPAISGDELVLEIEVPAAKAGELQLGPAHAFHGFRGWKSGAKAAAQSCNIDITCSQASAWTTDGASVARISIGGAYLCSGELINNVKQDRRRLFLTADHCGVDGAGGPAESVTFYFNYEGPCDDGQSQPLPDPTFLGATRLAHDVQSDFSLLLITDNRALPSTLYFAGWDATGVGADNGVAIHHPGGEEKKISFFDTPATLSTVNIGSGCVVDAWEVHWSSGTTESGSSGGGLWNAAHHLIGVLSGGFASCSTPTSPDYFARMDRGWTANAATAGQLKAHLDPDGSCVAVVPGLAATGASPGTVSPTPQNTLCEGQRSDCPGSHHGGGALPVASLLVLLGATLLRRRR